MNELFHSAAVVYACKLRSIMNYLYGIPNIASNNTANNTMLTKLPKTFLFTFEQFVLLYISCTIGFQHRMSQRLQCLLSYWLFC